MMFARSASRTLARAASTAAARHFAPLVASAAPRPFSTMDDLKTGTSAYMDLYPEQSTDGALRLGNIVPDFSCETTQGAMPSFHEWKKGKWAILFSHPAGKSI